MALIVLIHKNWSMDMKTQVCLLAVLAGLGGLRLTAVDEHMDMAAAMESHMNNPVHREVMTIFGLPEMQSELGLSATQANDLQRLKQELLAKSDELSQQIAMRRKELDGLLAGDTSRTGTVKTLFEKIANMQAELQYAGFETANRMKAGLTREQKAKFDTMKPMDVHHVVMSHANMADIEKTLQRLGFDEGAGMKMEMNHGMGMMDKMGMTDKMGMHGASNNGSAPKDGSQDSPATDHQHAGHEHH